MYALLDPGATLSFVIPYITVKFYVSPETLSEPLSASVSSSKFWNNQKGGASVSKSQGSISGTKTYPTCPKCGKNHPGECLAGREGCFGCGQSGHRVKNCPSARKGQEGNNTRAQSRAPIVPKGHPTQQGNSSGTGGRQRQNRLYALQAPRTRKILMM